MTTAQMNVPADVAGTMPDVGGASNEPMAQAPVRTRLSSGTQRSEEGGVWMIPATVVAAIVVGLVLRVVASDLRYEIAFIGLGILLAGSAGGGLLLSRRA